MIYNRSSFANKLIYRPARDAQYLGEPGNAQPEVWHVILFKNSAKMNRANLSLSCIWYTHRSHSRLVIRDFKLESVAVTLVAGRQMLNPQTGDCSRPKCRHIIPP